MMKKSSLLGLPITQFGKKAGKNCTQFLYRHILLFSFLNFIIPMDRVKIPPKSNTVLHSGKQSCIIRYSEPCTNCITINCIIFHAHVTIATKCIVILSLSPNQSEFLEDGLALALLLHTVLLIAYHIRFRM